MQSPECSQSRVVAAFVSADLLFWHYEFIYAATRCLPSSCLARQRPLPISIVMCVWSFFYYVVLRLIVALCYGYKKTKLLINIDGLSRLYTQTHTHTR